MNQDRPRPAILIAGPRTGGTFLACCLSNHPEIFCPRGEPFHPRSRWRHACPNWRTRLDLILDQQWHAVSMCKMMWDTAFHPETWEALVERDGMRFLYLERQSVLHQAVSTELNDLHSKNRLPSHRCHAFERVKPERCELDPQRVVDRIGWIEQRIARNRAMLRKVGVPYLYLSYEQVTGGRETGKVRPSVARAICRFLDIRPAPLFSKLKKTHRRPYSETLTNWNAIVSTLRAVELGRVLAPVKPKTGFEFTGSEA